MIKAAIIGQGDSLKAFNPKIGYNYVMGANDAIVRCPSINVVACMDKYADIRLKRKGFFDTPNEVPFYHRLQDSTWKPYTKERGNSFAVKTRRWNSQYDLNPYEHLFHGYHTPFFLASLALSKYKADELYFFGCDGGAFTERNLASVIREYNYLSEWCKVFIPASSSIWWRQQHDNCHLTDNKGRKVDIFLSEEIEKI